MKQFEISRIFHSLENFIFEIDIVDLFSVTRRITLGLDRGTPKGVKDHDFVFKLVRAGTGVGNPYYGPSLGYG